MDQKPEEFQPIKRRPGRPSKDEPVEMKSLDGIINPLGAEFANILKKAFYILAERDAHYSGNDTFSNFKSSGKLGIPEWLSVMNRMEDKISRAENQAVLVMKGQEAGDLEDTLLDLGNYAFIAAYFFARTKPKEE